MEHTIHYPASGRYFTLGEKASAREIWIVLHGYGQLATYFIRKFACLAKEQVYVIAPEALSRFYLTDITDAANHQRARVGASWMTRENRIADIENYIAFLNSVYRHEVSSFTGKISVLGFSQGAATASRWVFNGQISFHRLILWAGVFPPDLDAKRGKEVLQDKETVMVFGTSDPYRSDARFARPATLDGPVDVAVRLIEFDGGHQIHEPTLLTLV